jgi:hypothetical protein
MYTLDKIAFLTYFFLSKLLKLVLIVSVLTIIFMFIIALTLLTSGLFVIPGAFFSWVFAMVVFCYIVYYIVSDLIEITIIYLDPLNPKTFISLLVDRIPGFNIIFIAIKSSYDPFQKMKSFSY